jgi:hypothetical protein
LSFVFCLKGQNLVQNGDFEDTVSCPTSLGQIIKSTGWDAYSSSPDYYNSCSSAGGNVSVPDNIMGHRYPASGNAYCGAICYVKSETDYSQNREIIGEQLSSALVVGQKYFASFKVSAVISTNAGNMASNKLGMLFSTQPYTNFDSTTIPPIQNFAHIYSDSIIVDTLNWTMISGSFVADSAYTYISIGNFFKTNSTDTLTLINNPVYGGSYYFFDDVKVSTDSLFAVSVTNNKATMVNPLVLFPNPNNGVFKMKIYDSHTRSHIYVYNLLGENVYENEFIHSETLDLSFLNSGAYSITFITSENSFSTKLIIQK